ncbi:MAG: hypothetical protein HY037_01300 [Nitrospirae bacterium]|nr:hypothetical protein [Candidatus Troglogloeales bacterium]
MATLFFSPDSAIAESEIANSSCNTALSAPQSAFRHLAPHRTGEYASVANMASGLVFQATLQFSPKSIADFGFSNPAIGFRFSFPLCVLRGIS